MSLFPMYDEKRDYSGVMQAVAATKTARETIVENAADSLHAAIMHANKSLLNMYAPTEICRLFCKTVDFDFDKQDFDFHYMERLLKEKPRDSFDKNQFIKRLRTLHKVYPIQPEVKSKPNYTLNTILDFTLNVINGKRLSPLEQRLYDMLDEQYGKLAVSDSPRH